MTWWGASSDYWLTRLVFQRALAGGPWWDRELMDAYLPPLSLDHRQFKAALAELGWVE